MTHSKNLEIIEVGKENLRIDRRDLCGHIAKRE